MMRFDIPLAFLHPRYWLIWIGFGLLWLCVKLPYRFQIQLGRCLGRIALPFSSRRRKITEINLRACFPALTEAELQALVKRSFESAGIAIFEFGMGWWMPRARIQQLVQFEGKEHLENALSQGKGALIIVAHFMTIEIGGRALSEHISYDAVYRKHKNPLVDWLMHKARETRLKKAIARNDVRGFLKSFKENRPVLYLPDQDYGAKHSIFVPFFNIPAATITATTRIVKMSKAPVLPYFVYRRADGKGYVATLHPPLENFPTDDEYEDARRINSLIEQAILKSPEQYLWQHRRFKTRPHGEPSFYDE